MSMLSDERIIEIMNDAYGFGPDGIEDALSDLTAGDMDAVQSMNGIRNCIRAALAEAAQVPVMGLPGDWRIDTSAGRPILVYNGCSVIETEQAEYVLNLIKLDNALSTITQAELDAKDARIRELEEAALAVCMATGYETARQAVIHLNTVLRHAAIAKERQS